MKSYLERKKDTEGGGWKREREREEGKERERVKKKGKQIIH